MFLFSQPFLARRVIIYVDQQDSSSGNAQILVGVTVLIYLGIAMSRAVFMHQNSRLNTLVRGILVSHILAKNLRIESDKASKSSAMSLINADIEALLTNLFKLCDYLVYFVEIGIGAYLLTSIVGRSSLLVIIPLLCEFSILELLSSEKLTLSISINLLLALQCQVQSFC